MNAAAYRLFDTAIGRCAIAWGASGIASVQLPAADDARTRARILRRCPGATEGEPPADVRRAIDAITALLRGEAIDLGAIELDMTGVPAFDRAVYEVARTIPPGATLSYGEVAARLGDPGLARAVGQALGRNPFAPVVPCHRVLAAGGRIGGFSATGGAALKTRLLLAEGARVGDAPSLFDADPAGGAGR
jgi:methylated-DNA-[protein]-cysteine S-methyltransferase